MMTAQLREHRSIQFLIEALDIILRTRISDDRATRIPKPAHARPARRKTNDMTGPDSVHFGKNCRGIEMAVQSCDRRRVIEINLFRYLGECVQGRRH